MSVDEYYTPPELARTLADCICKKHKSVIDFCAGEGMLLEAVERKWPLIKCYALDLSRNAVNAMLQKHSDWRVAQCDFLVEKERQLCNLLHNQFDLIVLNPPFSCKSSVRFDACFDGKYFKVSTSMLFVIYALSYMAAKGEMYAILPSSVAYSEKDYEIWTHLNKKYIISIISETKENFIKCSPNVILISLKHGRGKKISIEHISHHLEGLTCFRGKISMHEIQETQDEVPFLIHSTNLRNNMITGIKYRVLNTNSHIDGPGILFHRVGKPDIKKLTIIPDGTRYALSDCVFFVKTKTCNDAQALREIFLNNWSQFSSLYKGTGAQYLTMKKVKQFLGLI
jgi:predicted RNA methylase